jgi:AcrR family transcriptional regulator
MSHREDLLAGAVRCLREKGYAHTTARDIVAASGTNLASIGYHYGSTKALLNAAVIQALDEFGAQMAQAIGTDAAAGVTAAERLERFWTRVIDSFQTSREVWLATFDIFTVAQRDPEVRAAVAAGIDDARIFWAQTLYGVDPADERRARAIGSLHQALVSGVMVQWLIDPERAPTPADLAQALPAIAAQVIATKPTATKPTATKSTATEPTAIEPTATKPTATKSTATEPG